MSTESLYSVCRVSSEGNAHTVSVELNPCHSVYEGHFPEQPVLPGVCTLQIIRECAGMVLQRTIRFKTIAQCKFTSMILPTQKLMQIDLTIGAEDALTATVRVNEVVALKLKSTFTDL